MFARGPSAEESAAAEGATTTLGRFAPCPGAFAAICSSEISPGFVEDPVVSGVEDSALEVSVFESCEGEPAPFIAHPALKRSERKTRPRRIMSGTLSALTVVFPELRVERAGETPEGRR